MYSDKILKEIKKPKNMGEIKNPDGVGMVGNPVCGDIMKIFIKILHRNNKEYIGNIKFQTLGCGAAIATSSIITQLVKGNTLAYAKKINGRSVILALGGMPEAKVHCSVLADKALKKAIEDYLKKK